MVKRTIVILLISLVWVACSSQGPTPEITREALSASPTVTTPTPFEPVPEPTGTATPTLEPTPELPPEGYGPDQFPEGVNPLTGLPVDDPALLQRRPLAVKVTNFPRYTRPQWGLSLADIVIEYYQNGGISRYHAVFYGQNAERVGPIRSARFFDSTLIRMFKSVFAFGSGDYRVLDRFGFSDFAARAVNEYPAGCGPMCRVDPNTYNHLVTDTEALAEYIESQGVDNSRQDLTGMYFHPDPPAGGESADQIYVRYGSQVYARWDYDPVSHRYARFQDAENDFGTGEEYEPLTDQLTEQPISANNVVVLLVPHEYFSQDPEIIEILLNGSGPGYAVRDGQVFDVRWNHTSSDQVLRLNLPDGSPYPFKPGNTWYEVLGQSSNVSQPEGGVHRFQFSIP